MGNSRATTITNASASTSTSTSTGRPWKWSAFRLGASFLLLASVAVGISVPLGPIHLVQVSVAVILIALSLFALLASDLQSVLRLAIASGFGAVAAFGLITPWAMCRWIGTAYVGSGVCPPDCDKLKTVQASRLRWAAGLSIGAAVLLIVPQRIFDGGASSIVQLIRTDVDLIALMIGLH